MSCMSSIISLMKCQMSFWTQISQNFKMALVKEYLWGALENIFFLRIWGHIEHWKLAVFLWVWHQNIYLMVILKILIFSILQINKSSHLQWTWMQCIVGFHLWECSEPHPNFSNIPNFKILNQDITENILNLFGISLKIFFLFKF